MIQKSSVTHVTEKKNLLANKSVPLSTCCKEIKRTKTSKNSVHPDHHSHLVALRRIQGQIAGLEKMIVMRRYCVDVMTQFRAASASLRTIEASILETHLRNCVQSAIESKNKTEVENKIDELMKLFSKR